MLQFPCSLKPLGGALPWEERDNWKISLTMEATNSILVLVVK